MLLTRSDRRADRQGLGNRGRCRAGEAAGQGRASTGAADGGVPRNPLHDAKLVINQVYENMGLQSTQTLATLFDASRVIR